MKPLMMSVFGGVFFLGMTSISRLEAAQADLRAIAIAVCDSTCVNGANIISWNGRDVANSMKEGKTYYIFYKWDANALAVNMAWVDRVYEDSNYCVTDRKQVTRGGDYTSAWTYGRTCEPSAGRHTLRVVVDGGGDVSESNEGNNSFSRSVTVSMGTGPASYLWPDDPGMIIYEQPAEFSWVAGTRATWYRLWINRNGTKFYDTWIQGTTWTADIDFPSGSYEWWVQTWSSAGGLGDWSPKALLTVHLYHVAGINPLAPKGSQTARNLQFSWTSGTGATWYQLWMNRNQQKHTQKWIEKSTSCTLDGLPSGRYQWWVRGWNPDGYGSWSANADFTIDLSPPGGCIPVRPTGTLTGTRRPQFGWTASSGASWYYLWINRDSVKYDTQWVEGATSWTPTADVPHGSYAWWVRPWNPDGHGPWSVQGDFQLNSQ